MNVPWIYTWLKFLDQNSNIIKPNNTKCQLVTVEAKDAEVKKLLEKKDLDLEEMKKRLKNQEKERQSELLKIQMEVSEEVCLLQCFCLITLVDYSSFASSLKMLWHLLHSDTTFLLWLILVIWKVLKNSCDVIADFY